MIETKGAIACVRRLRQGSDHRYDLSELPARVAAPKFSKAKRRRDGSVPSNVAPLNLGKAYLWSGNFPIPRIGHRVHVHSNGLGPGIVESYFVEYGWLGLHVLLQRVPVWQIEQGHEHPGQCLVFGCEIDNLELGVTR